MKALLHERAAVVDGPPPSLRDLFRAALDSPRKPLALLLVIFTACGGSGSMSSASLAGSYDLEAINGASLPYLLSSGGTSHVRVLNDRIVLHPNGTFGELGFNRVTWTDTGGEVRLTVADSGSYSVVGSTVYFTFNSGSTARSPILGGRFSMIRSGDTYSYVKE